MRLPAHLCVGTLSLQHLHLSVPIAATSSFRDRGVRVSQALRLKTPARPHGIISGSRMRATRVLITAATITTAAALSTMTPALLVKLATRRERQECRDDPQTARSPPDGDRRRTRERVRRRPARDGVSYGDCPFAHYARMSLALADVDYELRPTPKDAKPQRSAVRDVRTGRVVSARVAGLARRRGSRRASLPPGR